MLDMEGMTTLSPRIECPCVRTTDCKGQLGQSLEEATDLIVELEIRARMKHN